NVPARIRLAEVHVAAGRADSARVHLEEARRLPPEPPEVAIAPLEAALAALRLGDAEGAIQPLAEFHQAIRLTAPYQATLMEMGWEEGPLTGRPVLTFAPDDFVALRALREQAGEGAITFEEASAGSGLPENEMA